MTTAVLQPEHFEAGMPVDPQGEEALFRWSLSKPRIDLEPIPVPPTEGAGRFGGGDMEAEHNRELAEYRRALGDDSREVGRLER